MLDPTKINNDIELTKDEDREVFIILSLNKNMMYPQAKYLFLKQISKQKRLG